MAFESLSDKLNNAFKKLKNKGKLSEDEMRKIDDCINCRQCAERCPYELSTPELLKENWEDYKAVLAGEVQV